MKRQEVMQKFKEEVVKLRESNSLTDHVKILFLNKKYKEVLKDDIFPVEKPQGVDKCIEIDGEVFVVVFPFDTFITDDYKFTTSKYSESYLEENRGD